MGPSGEGWENMPDIAAHCADDQPPSKETCDFDAAVEEVCNFLEEMEEMEFSSCMSEAPGLSDIEDCWGKEREDWKMCVMAAGGDGSGESGSGSDSDHDEGRADIWMTISHFDGEEVNYDVHIDRFYDNSHHDEYEGEQEGERTEDYYYQGENED